MVSIPFGIKSRLLTINKKGLSYLAQACMFDPFYQSILLFIYLFDQLVFSPLPKSAIFISCHCSCHSLSEILLDQLFMHLSPLLHSTPLSNATFLRSFCMSSLFKTHTSSFSLQLPLFFFKALNINCHAIFIFVCLFSPFPCRT